MPAALLRLLADPMERAVETAARSAAFPAGAVERLLAPAGAAKGVTGS
ncbi:hypothetical protein [Streptomyces himalayensis]|uniref:Uncharacterized protein n=1 Tax=Streptomyces himalayensis subsp. himalayensis TaxID=2756131 RepID=A0A7W0DID8_9ACTN|nr:hypothetical protein [Streptomyces himalayensis]MBA2945657.1 hypothetical protein [Streptomyces himalayensis subsp. himalayensis]